MTTNASKSIFDGKYIIYENGDLWSEIVGRFLNPCDRGNGYRFYTLKSGSKYKKYSIHRLVAMSFIPNPEGKPEVNHIDGVKTNNHVSNLEWSTPRENIRHAYATGLMKSEKKV